jgi:hypothetical protein
MRSSSVDRGAARAWVLALAFLIVLSGCAATKIKEVFQDDAYQGHPKNVLVVAVASNITVRRTIESGFAKQLKNRGAGATESFRVLPEGTELSGDAGRDAIVAIIKERGIDAVLLTRVTGRRSDVRDIPGMTITTGFGYPYGSYGAWGGYSAVVYSSGPTSPTTQGYSHETKFLDIETHLFDTAAEKLIWAARTETRLSGTPQEEIKPYIDIITRELFQTNLF